MSDEGVATDPSRATADNERAPGPPDDGDALARAIEELRAIGRDLIELASLRLDRAKLGARETAFRLLIGTWLVIAAVAATVFATYLVVQGAVGGLSELMGGQLWAARLVGGLVVLMLIAATLIVSRRRRRRGDLVRLRSKYASRASTPDDGATR